MLLGGAVATCPLPVSAQQAGDVRRIGAFVALYLRQAEAYITRNGRFGFWTNLDIG
jgi:hypothetical protein